MLRASPIDPYILIPKIWYLSATKLVWGEKKVISKSFLYFYSIFFSVFFSTTRSYVLYQELSIYFYTRLSLSTKSFSLVFFSSGTLSHSGEIFARLEKMGSEDAKLLERVFSYFAENNKNEKARWQIVRDALKETNKYAPNFSHFEKNY